MSSTTAVIETPEILLRPISKEDRQDFTFLLTLPAFGKLSPFGPLSVEQAHKVLDSLIAHSSQTAYGFWTVIDKKTNAYAGFVGHQPVTFENKEEQRFLLGFNRKFWGSDRPLLAAKAACVHSFKQQKVSRMLAFVHPEDVENLHIAQTIGSEFAKECLFFGVTVLLFLLLPAQLL